MGPFGDGSTNGNERRGAMGAVMRHLVWHRAQQTRGDSGGRRVSTKEAFGNRSGPIGQH